MHIRRFLHWVSQCVVSLRPHIFPVQPFTLILGGGRLPPMLESYLREGDPRTQAQAAIFLSFREAFTLSIRNSESLGFPVHHLP